jgi:hypothetical protein
MISPEQKMKNGSRLIRIGFSIAIRFFVKIADRLKNENQSAIDPDQFLIAIVSAILK